MICVILLQCIMLYLPCEILPIFYLHLNFTLRGSNVFPRRIKNIDRSKSLNQEPIFNEHLHR